jgi:virginiamycin A acetyltransferase
MLSKIARRLWGIRISRNADPSWMRDNPKYKGFEIGEWTYGDPLVLSWGQGTSLYVGKFCSIAAGTTIMLGGEHQVNWVTTYPFAELISGFGAEARQGSSKGDVVIENDVWIGLNALILSGVSIGNGAIVGAGSVVTKNVAPYSIVAGNPARHLRYRVPQDSIDKLQRIAWWTWPIDDIRRFAPLLLSGDIEGFIAAARCRSGTVVDGLGAALAVTPTPIQGNGK